jgi:hypothetical protein
VADDQSWACKQFPNGMNPIVVCEREALRAVLDAIDALHQPDSDGDICDQCLSEWPCPTVRLLHPEEADRG